MICFVGLPTAVLLNDRMQESLVNYGLKAGKEFFLFRNVTLSKMNWWEFD